jgi:molybdate-binding protein
MVSSAKKGMLNMKAFTKAKVA